MWVSAGVTLMMQRLRRADRSAARGLVLDLRAVDAYCWQILTSCEAGPWVDVLVITMRLFLTRAVCEAYLDI